MRHRLRPLPILVALVSAIMLALAFIYLAPTTLGGSTVYSFTYGTSMQPKLHKGDLIVVRKGGTPVVGDAVLYNNRDLKQHVLHRIIRIDGDRLVMKGDNNAFIDTFQPTRADVVGKLWFKVGGAGKVTGWLGAPLHAALLTGAVALLSLLGTGLKAQRRQRRRRDGGATPPGRSTATHAHHVHPGPVPGQVAQVMGGILGVVALACALLAALSYGRSPTRLGHGPALYAQQGVFAYEAQVPAGPVYENGRLTTGQPAYVQVVRSLRVSFAYEVATTASHTLFGTTSLAAEMANGSGWSRTFPLAVTTAFSGDRVTITGILQLAALRALATRVEAVTGQVPDTYTITIRPQVTLSGQVGGTAVKDAFSPPLQLNLDRYKLTLPPPGANPEGELQRAQDGPATKRRVANTLSVLGAKLEVQSARRLATVLGLAALAGALGVGLLFLLGLRRADEPARIRARFGHLIVEIAAPRRRFAEHDVVMASFEDLVRVSDRHGRMILHAREGDRHVYLVEDDGIAYRFEAQGRPEQRSQDVLGRPLGGGSPADREPAER